MKFTPAKVEAEYLRWARWANGRYPSKQAKARARPATVRRLIPKPWHERRAAELAARKPKPPPTPPPAQPVHPILTAPAAWIIDHSAVAPEQLAPLLQLGVSTLYVKVHHDQLGPGEHPEVPAEVGRLIERDRALGFRVLGWGWLGALEPETIAYVVGRLVDEHRLAGYSGNAEDAWENAGRTISERFMGRLRSYQPTLPVSLCTFDGAGAGLGHDVWQANGGALVLEAFEPDGTPRYDGEWLQSWAVWLGWRREALAVLVNAARDIDPGRVGRIRFGGVHAYRVEASLDRPGLWKQLWA